MAEPRTTGLPGLNLPLDYTPDTEGGQIMFPSGLDRKVVEQGGCDRFHTLREITMMKMINTVTEQDDWHLKISDAKWVHRCKLDLKRRVKDVTSPMLKWVLDECRWRAFLFRQSGSTSTLVFDAFVKSDNQISIELSERLKELVKTLEEKFGRQESSTSQLIVDPSRYPLAYGRTRVLLDNIINIDNCLISIGKGTPIFLHEANRTATSSEDHLQTAPTSPGPPPPEYDRWGHRIESKPYSWCDENFQLLPCDLSLQNGLWCITSYINDLHPVQHRQLYTTLEEIINQCVQPWNECLAQWSVRWNRVPLSRVVFTPRLRNLVVPEGLYDDRVLDWIDCKVDQWRERRSIKFPEPGEFDSSKIPKPKHNLVEKFGHSGMQVLVQLGAVLLEPPKTSGPERRVLNRGQWHLQGHLNEHICATAVYCYGLDNVVSHYFEFRQRSDEGKKVLDSHGYEHHQIWADVCREVFGYQMNGDDLTVFQRLGHISVGAGRLVAFPNTLEIRSVYLLRDESKPGHCHILTLCLVDPHMRIISTANVPPQQPKWWAPRKQLIHVLLRSKLPQELVDMVLQNLRDLADGPMSPEEHKSVMDDFLKSRRKLESNQKKNFGLPRQHNEYRGWYAPDGDGDWVF